MIGLLVVFGVLGLCRADTICCTAAQYGVDNGCFNDNSPFSHLPLPECPCTRGGSCPSSSFRYPNYDFYSRSNSNRQTFDRNGPPPSYSFHRDTIFLVHGWNNDENTRWINNLKNTLLVKDNYNVIIAGWGDGSGRLDYRVSASNTRTAGAELNQIARMLVSQGDSYSRMWCIGHSLGSHVCGHAGMELPTRFGRVTGLDPAGPWFETSPGGGVPGKTVGLNQASASLVDIIHTDVRSPTVRYGTVRDIGHKDFYPNGVGSSMPGCSDPVDPPFPQPPDFAQNYGDIGCSHGKAIDYFEASINSNGCRATQSCNNYNNIPGSCSNCIVNCPQMGFNAIEGGGNGMWYLTTAANGPNYC